MTIEQAVLTIASLLLVATMGVHSILGQKRLIRPILKQGAGVMQNPLARFIHANPTVVMLALGFLLVIGMTLIAEGFGAHVPKGYIYAAMAFSALVEGLNMMGRKASARKQAVLEARQAELNRAETAEPGV